MSKAKPHKAVVVSSVKRATSGLESNNCTKFGFLSCTFNTIKGFILVFWAITNEYTFAHVQLLNKCYINEGMNRDDKP